MNTHKTYHKPLSIQGALEIAAENKNEFRFLAGGTDVMMNRYQDNDKKPCLIDITGIDTLRGVTIENDKIVIGALTSLEDIINNEIIIEHFPQLSEAAQAVGAPLIRKTATLGGNILCENRCIFYNQSEWWREAAGNCLKCGGDICIATQGKKACFSEFVSDTVPVLIALDAQLNVEYPNDSKQLEINSIYTGLGEDSKNLAELAIIKSIEIPLNKYQRLVFKKLRERESMEFTSLTSVVAVDQDGNLKIVLAGVHPAPVLVEGRVSDDLEALKTKAYKAAKTVENDILSRKYRKDMIKVFIEQSLEELEIVTI